MIRGLSRAQTGCRREGSSHVGPQGVLAVPSSVSRQQLERMICHAREFAAEWTELRAVLRNRLSGFCLQAPLKVCGALPQECRCRKVEHPGQLADG